MALRRYAGNRFDGDTLADRISVPITLPNGTIFLDLETRNEYVLNNGSWTLKGGGFTTRGSSATSTDFDLTLFERNSYTSGDAYIPNLVVPMSAGENSTFIWGTKFTNYLTNFHQRGTTQTVFGGVLPDSTPFFRLEDASPFSQTQLTGGYGYATRIGGTELGLLFNAFNNSEILPTFKNDPNPKYTAFCVLDQLSGKMTGFYVDFTTGGNWFQVGGTTGNNMFVGSACKINATSYIRSGSANITGVRFRLNFSDASEVKFREIGIWSKYAIPTYYTHVFKNLTNLFTAPNIFGSTLTISGGVNGTPSSGQVLTALDSKGQAVWRDQQTTINRAYFTTGVTITSGNFVTIPDSLTYETGANKLHVYVSGLYKRINPSRTNGVYDYYEWSSNQVLFTKDIQPNAPIAYVIFR